MKVRIRNTVDLIKYTETSLDLDTTLPIKDVIPHIREHLKIKDEEVKYLIIDGKIQTEITDFNKSLEDYKLNESNSLQVENKVSNFEISAESAISIAYTGPIVVFLYFLFSKGISNCHPVQIIGMVMSNLHYLKRVLETIYVHQYGKASFPVKDLFGLLFYYWVLYGVCVGYSLFNNSFDEYVIDYKIIIFIIMFFIAELNNLRSHLILNRLKANNNGQRGIPRGGMFEYVSCAHYFWELISWTSFALMTRIIPSYLFVIYSFTSMGFLAYGKHQGYLKYFGDTYPKIRKAFIPFIL